MPTQYLPGCIDYIVLSFFNMCLYMYMKIRPAS